jgi:acyl-coenzyme A thioesterase PaaI-like protein
VTLSLTTQFTKAVNDGRLRVEGRMLSAGRKNYSAEAHIYDDVGDLVAHGIGSFQWPAGSQPGAQTMISTRE